MISHDSIDGNIRDNGPFTRATAFSLSRFLPFFPSLSFLFFALHPLPSLSLSLFPLRILHFRNIGFSNVAHDTPPRRSRPRIGASRARARAWLSPKIFYRTRKYLFDVCAGARARERGNNKRRRRQQTASRLLGFKNTRPGIVSLLAPIPFSPMLFSLALSPREK